MLSGMSDDSKDLSKSLPGGDLVPREMVDAAIDCLRDGMQATKRVRAGGGDYEDVPDHKVRMECAVRSLEFAVGKAVSRQLVGNVDMSGGKDRLTNADVVAALADRTDILKIIERARSSARMKLAETDDETDETIDI